MSNDEVAWEFVTKRKCGKTRQKIKKQEAAGMRKATMAGAMSSSAIFTQQDAEISFENFISHLNPTIAEMKYLTIHKLILEELTGRFICESSELRRSQGVDSGCLNDTHIIINVVILGIGNFSQSQSSLYQLALILSVLEVLSSSSFTKAISSSSTKLQESSPLAIKSMIYDPLLTTLELEICKHYQLSISKENCKGKYTIPSEALLGVFYMPHCPYQLYNNVLWSNWEILQRILIIGNSFSYYDITRALLSSKSDDRTTDCIKSLRSLLTEVSLSLPTQKTSSSSSSPTAIDYHRLAMSLNDTSVMYYESEKLETCVGKHIIATMKASEESINQATAADGEIFA